ncbi:hypothetical protein D0809_09865 [Flavobacterium circumlabens]|uniref:Uncharacterized protein n=1 Tax=Flavobacterium circumlabens TaxID=2133765 RepID=A0A4Y7UC97_9FLAO|nr:hypothetical protein D0809_09865 [Flavobacterium circumlabens]
MQYIVCHNKKNTLLEHDFTTIYSQILQNFAIEIFNNNNITKYKNRKALIPEEFRSDFQIKEIDKPIPANEEVLVRIKAIGINTLDRTFKIFLENIEQVDLSLENHSLKNRAIVLI